MAAAIRLSRTLPIAAKGEIIEVSGLEFASARLPID